jgi:hypothetical protein
MARRTSKTTTSWPQAPASPWDNANVARVLRNGAEPVHAAAGGAGDNANVARALRNAQRRAVGESAEAAFPMLHDQDQQGLPLRIALLRPDRRLIWQARHR